MPDLPYPRTREASEMGCECSFRDGEDQDNFEYPEWLTADCPVHSPVAVENWRLRMRQKPE